MQEVEIKLSDWVFNAIKAKEVLTLHRDYFRLRKPLERRMYELARKHCGQQEIWSISLALLQKKCGSKQERKSFVRHLRETVEADHLPDYTLMLDDEQVVFLRREQGSGITKPPSVPVIASTETVPGAGAAPAPSERRIMVSAQAIERLYDSAPGWDKYFLEHRLHGMGQGQRAGAQRGCAISSLGRELYQRKGFALRTNTVRL